MTLTASEQTTSTVVYDRPFDSDNHYYETLDAFTRHLDPKYKDRGIRVIQRGKRTELLAGSELFEFVPNPTFDPVIVPGCQDLLFRGQIPEGVSPRDLMKVEPLNPAYRDHDVRLRMIEEQGLSGILMLPTLACGVEEALKKDIPALMASASAFNRWLDEDWGFAYQGRIFSAPMLSFADPDAAVKELDWIIERRARVVYVRPAPIPAGYGRSKPFGAPEYDKVWAKLAEAGIAVAFHLSDSGYNTFAAAWGGPERFVPFRNPSPLASVLVSDRAIHDTIASVIIGGVLHRHPTLKIASIENGSDFIHLLIKRLRKQANQSPHMFHEDPADTIRKHLWVTPYYEEDIRKLADVIGVDRVLFGSDWPHGEGLETPTDFLKELHAFDEAEKDQIMRTNVLDLLGLEY
ncbi:amidohydrolase family protein [Cryptosporangium aurantiacum]|uniref:Amidohydrolase n=1 Tax=Cryptosporangium aurantiacum TaxID=134849 RepID=A0A1M7R3G6_9ACTN|nr:amidohydrolase family protein [Cryptosporangium aurantiacum]SHN39326.1 Amidohydrolase [Cryptosporangium aurantiacum]